MKGVILCGGEGKRLYPLTAAVNKHLLPIYDRPMVMHPLDTLISMGVDEIFMVCRPQDVKSYSDLFGGGYDSIKYENTRITLIPQPYPAGICHAVSLVRGIIHEKFAVILGDNVFGKTFQIPMPEGDMAIYIKQVANPSEFGVMKYSGADSAPVIVEKPEEPPSSDAVVGLYVYTPEVFDIIDMSVGFSKRGEMEVTDLNNILLRDGKIEIIRYHGFWQDAGSIDSLFYLSGLRKAGAI